MTGWDGREVVNNMYSRVTEVRGIHGLGNIRAEDDAQVPAGISCQTEQWKGCYSEKELVVVAAGIVCGIKLVCEG